jgi:hypothetical protein
MSVNVWALRDEADVLIFTAFIDPFPNDSTLSSILMISTKSRPCSPVEPTTLRALKHTSIYLVISLKLSNTFTINRRWGRPFVACGGFVMLNLELLPFL